jgi:hypothetical protein
MIGSPVDDVDGAWVSPDGTLVAVQGPDTGVTLWRWGADGQLSKLVDVPALTVSHLAFAPRNESLVIVSANRAQVWSVRERSYIGIGVTHDGPILDAQFSPDGRWVVSASQDGLARIWDAATGLPAADSFQLGQGVAAASFSPSGRRLLTAGIDGSVRVWELSGAEDAGDLERIWLARLAEILSGLQINPATMRPVPAVHAHEALQVLRGEVARKCPGMAGQPPLCASRTGVLVRTLLGLAAE